MGLALPGENTESALEILPLFVLDPLLCASAPCALICVILSAQEKAPNYDNNHIARGGLHGGDGSEFFTGAVGASTGAISNTGAIKCGHVWRRRNNLFFTQSSEWKEGSKMALNDET